MEMKKPPLSQEGVREARRGRGQGRQQAGGQGGDESTADFGAEGGEVKWLHEYSTVQYLWNRRVARQGAGSSRRHLAAGQHSQVDSLSWSVWRSTLLAEAGVLELEGVQEVTEGGGLADGGTDLPILHNTVLQMKPIKLLINTMRKT